MVGYVPSSECSKNSKNSKNKFKFLDASVRRFDFKTDFELDQIDIGKWVLHWVALQCFHETENYEYGRWHAKEGFLIDTRFRRDSIILDYYIVTM